MACFDKRMLAKLNESLAPAVKTTHACRGCGKEVPLVDPYCTRCFSMVYYVLTQAKRSCLQCGKDCLYGGVTQEDTSMLCFECDRAKHGNAWLKPSAVTITK